MSKRYNFSDKTKFQLAWNADFRCVYPGCGDKTHSANAAHDGIINTGNGAHIVAAGKHGPRPSMGEMTPAQIRAMQNGAWLCVKHANIVDKDESAYAAPMMRSWQAAVTNEGRRENIGTPLRANIDYERVCQKAMAFCQAASKINLHSDPRGGDRVVVMIEQERAIDALLQQCAGWNPVHPFHSLDPATVRIQEQALHYLHALKAELGSGRWWSEGGFKRIRLAGQVMPTQMERQECKQAAEAFSTNACGFNECLRRLNDLISGRNNAARSVFWDPGSGLPLH